MSMMPDPAIYSLAAILVAVLVGAASPGPSFVLVSRIAVSGSRMGGLAAAVGMGLGGTLFAALALLGLAALLQQVEMLHITLKVIGGAYLLYLGVGVWRQASAPLAAGEMERLDGKSVWGSFWLGFAVQITNPKTAAVYASIFAALLPTSPPTWLLLALPPLIFLVEAMWYCVVALILSSSQPRRLYLRCKVAIDRLAGFILGSLGLRLIFDGVGLPRDMISPAAP